MRDPHKTLPKLGIVARPITSPDRVDPRHLGHADIPSQAMADVPGFFDPHPLAAAYVQDELGIGLSLIPGNQPNEARRPRELVKMAGVGILTDLSFKRVEPSEAGSYPEM